VSRIVALLNRDGRPTEPAVLHQLAAPLRNPLAERARVVADGCAGLAYQCLRDSLDADDQQPGRAGGSLSLCFDGRLDNRDELIRELGPGAGSEPHSAPDWLLVLACYRSQGELFAAKLNGDYALALYDGSQRRMILARDPIGIRPLYYWHSRRTLVAASEIKAILEHTEVEARPDDDALADLLVGGNPSERRLTPFQGVLRVLPGHTVVVSPSGVKDLKHWDFDPMRELRFRSTGEYAEALRGLFEQAVRRRLRSRKPVAVSVSGGVDSSAILCQAEQIRKASASMPRVYGISRLFPEGSAADERRFLQDIEAHCAATIRTLGPAPIQAVDDPEWLRRLEYPSLPGTPDLECADAASKLSCSVLLDGYYGDQLLWSWSHLFDPLSEHRFFDAVREMRGLARTQQYRSAWQLAPEVLRAFARELIPDGLMQPIRRIRRMAGRGAAPAWWTERMRELAYRRSQRQRRPAGPYAGKHAELCYRLVRSSHVGGSFDLWNKQAAHFGIEVAYPFTDRELVAFIMAVPGGVLSPAGTYKGLFREAMRGILPEPIRLRFSKAGFTQLEIDATANLSSRGIEKLGASSMAVTRGYVDAGRLSLEIDRHRALLTGEDFAPARRLRQLYAFELWLREFFSPRTRRAAGMAAMD
jgi:asparagine synthase (glutamine-hydrolysing)